MTEVHAPVAMPDAAAPPEDESGALTRAGLFRMLLGGGAGAAGLTLLTDSSAFAASTPSRGSTAVDVTILQYALTLEYLGVALYESALANAHLTGAAREVAVLFRGHERAHVKFVSTVLKSLGATPHAPQTFDFGAATASQGAFLRTSATVEEMCVETLNGAGPLVSIPVLKGAAELVSVEARQASWVRFILGRDAAPYTFNPAFTAAESQAAFTKLGFIKGALS